MIKSKLNWPPSALQTILILHLQKSKSAVRSPGDVILAFGARRDVLRAHQRHCNNIRVHVGQTDARERRCGNWTHLSCFHSSFVQSSAWVC